MYTELRQHPYNDLSMPLLSSLTTWYHFLTPDGQATLVVPVIAALLGGIGFVMRWLFRGSRDRRGQVELRYQSPQNTQVGGKSNSTKTEYYS